MDIYGSLLYVLGTGLEGKCCVCLEDDQKLFALTPCGHTVCLDCCGDFIGKYIFSNVVIQISTFVCSLLTHFLLRV